MVVSGLVVLVLLSGFFIAKPLIFQAFQAFFRAFFIWLFCFVGVMS